MVFPWRSSALELDSSGILHLRIASLMCICVLHSVVNCVLKGKVHLKEQTMGVSRLVNFQIYIVFCFLYFFVVFTNSIAL